jgi:hypothetical protein
MFISVSEKMVAAFRIIVPAEALSASEKWNPNDSKKNASYGNPLTGFAIS